MLIERHDGTCKVGHALDRDSHCPICHVEPTVGNMADFLAVVERVSRFRTA